MIGLAVWWSSADRTRPMIALLWSVFLYLVQNFSHKIIGTTGSESADEIKARLSPKSKNPLKMLLSLEELESAVDIVISDYNGRPHASIKATPHWTCSSCV